MASWRPQIFYGWYVVYAVGLVLMTTSGLAFYNLSVLLDAFVAERGFPVALTSGATASFFIAAGAGIGFGLVTFTLAWVALKARRSKRLTGPDAMVGHRAVAITTLDPTGQVEVRGEIWAARLAEGSEAVPPGAELRVRAVDGLTHA